MENLPFGKKAIYISTKFLNITWTLDKLGANFHYFNVGFEGAFYGPGDKTVIPHQVKDEPFLKCLY